MGAPKRVPSFSARPGFPSGLRVLLVDADPEARARTEKQLRDCSYMVRAGRRLVGAASWRWPAAGLLCAPQRSCVPIDRGGGGPPTAALTHPLLPTAAAAAPPF